MERNKILYKLSLLWACRVGELRQAEVSHFDFEEGIWTVPWENHKTGRKSKTDTSTDNSRNATVDKTGH